MTAQELYTLLDAAGVEYEVVEIFEDARIINVKVEDADVWASKDSLEGM